MSWALVGLSLHMLKPSLLVMDLLPESESGVMIFSRLMLFPFPRWSASLRRPLRTASASLCTPSSKASYSISMYARPSSLPIFGASWSAFWFFFRDKGLGVPSIALLLDLFNVKEASKGFLYISKRVTIRPIISNLPSSHKHWKERYFFLSRVDIGNTTLPIKMIQWGFRQYGLPLRTCVSFMLMLVGVDFLKVLLCS